MGYLKDTARGVALMGALKITIRIITLVKIIILARLLTPNDFGLFGIATLVLALLEIITETGINVFLIQEKGKLANYENTAWTVSIFRGLTISLIIASLSPLIAVFFKSPEAKPLLLLVSLVPLIRGFVNPAIISFQKELKFAGEFYLRLGIYALDTLVAVSFALRFHNAFSFVAGLLAGALAELVLSFCLFKLKPKWEFNRKRFMAVVNRGKWVTFAGIFNYFAENLNSAAIGRLIDTLSLGYFQMALKISSLATTEIADVVQKVTLPVYAKIADDKQRLKTAYLKSLLVFLAAVLPLTLILFFFSRAIVSFVLGEKWLAIVGLIRLLVFYGLFKSLINISHPLFLSIKKQKAVAAITLVALSGVVATVIPLVNAYGLTGAIYAGFAGLVLAVPATIILLFKYL